MPIDLPSPTRMNFLLLKAQEEAARRGLGLLMSKREALVRELFSMTDQAIIQRDRFTAHLLGSVTVLALALGLEGRSAVRSAAFAARREIPLERLERNVWGVRFPELHHPGVVRAPDARGYALSGVSGSIHSTAQLFEQSLEGILQIISVEMRLKKIGGEVRKGTRRINALTERILPQIKRRMSEIRLALEERERESVFRMKRFKRRRIETEEGADPTANPTEDLRRRYRSGPPPNDG